MQVYCILKYIPEYTNRQIIYDICDYRKCPVLRISTSEMRVTIRRELDIILYRVIMTRLERRIIGIRRGHVNTRLITHLHF